LDVEVNVEGSVDGVEVTSTTFLAVDDFPKVAGVSVSVLVEVVEVNSTKNVDCLKVADILLTVEISFFGADGFDGLT
jgi:hypothetical protein